MIKWHGLTATGSRIRSGQTYEAFNCFIRYVPPLEVQPQLINLCVFIYAVFINSRNAMGLKRGPVGMRMTSCLRVSTLREPALCLLERVTESGHRTWKTFPGHPAPLLVSLPYWKSISVRPEEITVTICVFRDRIIIALVWPKTVRCFTPQTLITAF